MAQTWHKSMCVFPKYVPIYIYIYIYNKNKYQIYSYITFNIDDSKRSIYMKTNLSLPVS